MEQLTFCLKKKIHYSPRDFVVTSSNQFVHAYVASWPAWPTLGGVIVGPPHAGKTHLCHVWQRIAQAEWLTSETIEKINFATLEQKAFIIDDIDVFLPAYETTLFHLFNHLNAHKGFLLITSNVLPKNWTITLKDLSSRLSSLPVFKINDPDDALFLAILTKGFSDYQVQVPSKVLEFILKHVPRTFQALEKIPAQLHDISLQKKCNITIPFVKEILGL